MKLEEYKDKDGLFHCVVIEDSGYMTTLDGCYVAGIGTTKEESRKAIKEMVYTSYKYKIKEHLELIKFLQSQ